MTGQQLKNSILQMAVQGKLVPQDPNDEPASVLLERIRAEKEKLIKDGKIKKEKNPSVIFRGADNLPYEKIGKNNPICIADEVPFDIPDSWEWVRFKNLVNYLIGKTPPRKESSYWDSDDYKWVSISDMVSDGTILDTKECVNAHACKHIFGNRIIPEGTLLMSFKLTVGKVSILGIEALHNEAIISIFPYIDDKKATRDFLFVVLPLLSQYGNTKSAIKGNTLNSESLGNLFIPLPPLKEQKRIVEKYNTILPLLNNYTLLEGKVTKLNDNFPELLKKSILQEAVQGKLVPQDPNDEPASVLLERIREEKQRLIAEGKIKKDKHESVIFKRDNSHYEKCSSKVVCIDGELPFEIPKNWQWVKLSDLVQFIGGYAYKSETFIEKSEYQVLRLGNVKNDKIRYSTKPVFISKRLAEKTADFRCQTNDILITMTGTRLKRDYFYTVIVSENDTNCFINQRVGCLRCYLPNLCKWLIWVLKSEEVLSQVFQYETGTANQGNLGAENIMKTFIPLPPLDEQDRICKLIEHLLKQVNTL